MAETFTPALSQTVARPGWLNSLARAIPLIALSLVAVVLVLRLTPNGAGASGDSAHYVMGARNLLAGNGYVRISGGGELKPITGFPPAFSIVLAGLGLFGLDGFAAARYLNAALFGISIVLSGLLIHRASRSWWAAAVGCLLLLSSGNLIEIHSWVMSEGLYITLFLLSIWFVLLGIERESRGLLVIAGALAGVATLTRYVGFGLMLAGTLAILFLGEPDRRWRAASAALFLLVGVVPIAAWFLRNASASDSLVNRELLFHAMDADLLANYEAELIAWAFARQLPVAWRPRAVLAATVAAIGPLYFWGTWLRDSGAVRPREKGISRTLPWMLGFYLVAYLGVLAANSIFLDAATTLSAPERYLAPAYVALVILSTTTTAQLVTSFGSNLVFPRAFALGLGALLIALHTRQSVEFLDEPGLDLGYIEARRHSQDLVVGLKEIEDWRLIISNNPEMVYVLADRPAYILPASHDPYSDRPNQDYLQEVKRARSILAKGGVMVIFGKPDELALHAMEDIGVEPIVWFTSAIIYGAPSSTGG